MPNFPRERLLIQQYIAAIYPHHRVIFNCPLGPVPESLVIEYGQRTALRVARRMRPAVDVLVFDKRRLILIEAKVAKWLDGIAKLPVYKAMVPLTPELENFNDWQVDMVMCIPFTQDNMLSVANLIGVDVVEFSSPEIDEYLEHTLPNYSTAAYKRRRAEILRTRELLGVE